MNNILKSSLSKIKPILIFLTVFFCGCSGSTPPEYNFKPEISEWIMKTYKDDISDYGIKEIKSYVTSYKKEGSLMPGAEEPEYFVNFNKAGFKTEETFFYNSNEYYDKKYTYKYNKKNIKIEQGLYLLPDNDPQNMLFKFDTSGNLVEQYKFDKSHKVESKSIFRYNLQNKIRERINYKGKNELEDKFIYEYDSNGNMVRINYYNPVNILRAYKIFKYDSFDNMVSEGAYNNLNAEQFRFEYKYDVDDLIDSAYYYSPTTGQVKYCFQKDDEGNVLLIVGHDSKGKIFKKYRFQYAYHYSMDRFAVNSTLIPVSRAVYEGTLTAGYIQTSSIYFPVKRFRSDNIDCEMSWYDSQGGGLRTIKGKARLSTRKKGDKNISSSVIMDYSGSMGNEDRGNIQRAAEMFVNKMSYNDEAMITKFNVDVIRKTEFTNDKYTLTSAINDKYDYSNLTGGTALYDAINYGVENVKYKDFREFVKCVIALTDGGENSSYNKDREYLITNAREYGIPVYTIGYGIEDAENNCKGHYDPPRKDLNFCEWDLWDIANRTGGFYYYAPRNSNDISDVYNSISGQLGSTFDLYLEFPANELPASGTKVTVKVIVTYRKNIQTIERNFTLE